MSEENKLDIYIEHEGGFATVTFGREGMKYLFTKARDFVDIYSQWDAWMKLRLPRRPDVIKYMFANDLLAEDQIELVRDVENLERYIHENDLKSVQTI